MTVASMFPDGAGLCGKVCAAFGGQHPCDREKGHVGSHLCRQREWTDDGTYLRLGMSFPEPDGLGTHAFDGESFFAKDKA